MRIESGSIHARAQRNVSVESSSSSLLFFPSSPNTLRRRHALFDSLRQEMFKSGKTYSDLETLIGEDEGGVGGGELGVRHCWGLLVGVSCLGRYRSVRIRASTQRIVSSREVFEVPAARCGLSNSIGGPLGGGASLACARVMRWDWK